MPLITPIQTTDTFRTWVTRTNTVIDLLNSNTVVVGGNAIGAFTIGNSSHTNTSLSLNGGKTLANLSGLFLAGNSTFGANVSVNSSALVVSVSANTTLFQSPGGTVVNASPLSVNAAATFNGAVTFTASGPLTIGNVASFASNVSVANNLVASNTAYMRSSLFSESGAVIAATVSSPQYDNYNPSGLHDAQVVHLNPDTQNIILTGIVAPTNLSIGAKVLYLQNLSGSYKITLKSEDPSSSALNRFKTVSNQDVDVPPGGSIPLLYTTATGRWRLLAAPAGTSTTLSVSGAATFSDTVNVTGVASFTSNVAVDSNVLFVDTVNNRVGVNISSPTSPLHVVGNSLFGNVTIGGTASITGAATFSNTASVAGAVNALSTFGVTGAVNALSTLGVTGAVNALSTFGVTGATTLNSTLAVLGAADLRANVSVNAIARFDSTGGRLVLPVGTNKWAS